MCARRHTINGLFSFRSPCGGLDVAATGSATGFPFLGGSSISAYPPSALKQILCGQALWEAASQSGKNPWYNSYDDFASQIRSHGKDYSVVPEFRISDHINYYEKTANGDYLADVDSLFEVTGGLADRNTSSEARFFDTYSNSDFMKYFEFVRNDHSELAEAHSISLRCNALLKFLPYDGFYPAERTVQLAEQFSASFSPYVSLAGNSAHIVPQIGLRTFFTPFYAPGIMYNSIKSGIAVDFPIFSSSVDYILPIYKGSSAGGAAAGSRYISGSSGRGRFDFRVPFEAIIDPAKYISDLDIVDMEPHLSCALNVTASWGGQGDDLYKMMAHNFFAEVPDFFLKESQFATITSQPENRFASVDASKKYAARIKMFKSLNKPVLRTGSLGYRNPLVPLANTYSRQESGLHETFTMYSRPSAIWSPLYRGARNGW